MKTEMKMLDNGNYESVICPLQHQCVSEDYTWKCSHYSWENKNLRLEIHDGDPYEDGYQNHIYVKYCPFCGYKSD